MMKSLSAWVIQFDLSPFMSCFSTIPFLSPQRVPGKVAKLKMLLSDVSYMMKHGDNASPVALPNQPSSLNSGDHFLPTVQTHVIAECPPSPTPPPAAPQPAVTPASGRAPSAASSSTSSSSRRSAAPPPAAVTPTPETGSGSSLQVSCPARSALPLRPSFPLVSGPSGCFPSRFVCHFLVVFHSNTTSPACSHSSLLVSCW